MLFQDFKTLCQARRSIRYFDASPLTEPEVLQLLDVAHLAPSVENLQPWHFHVVFNKELRHKLTVMSCYGNFVEGASVFIIVTADRSVEKFAKEPVWNEKEIEYSCMAAMTNILHGATAMGIGSCWVSLYRGNVHELLGLPPNEIVVGGIMLGRFKKGEEHAGYEQDRKSLQRTYTIHN